MKTSSLKLVALASAAAVLQLTSCVSTEREVSTSTVDPRSTYTPPPAGSRSRVTSKTVLNTVSVTHSFSSPDTKDNFILQLRGPRVLTAQAHLIVTSSTGDTLRHEVLPARALINDKSLIDPQASTSRAQEIAILEGMNNFFADGRFSQPAVPVGAAQPAEMDTKTWAALREDASAVGFDYIGAGGEERRMTYARKLGKAVVINQ
ncbi:hypothetical protein [Hymenobacter glacialis]|uniref:Uncharacterized protein n=1 Tax=Hymenobacter glacialis TaxID=1908236 RepID=A0A1G1T7K7_9BACT|nr:hypothetical protein [Hymenobacter glacialis]OGX86860.1 hypothetical protein BEN48_00395 [Hymenobacter glacialis]